MELQHAIGCRQGAENGLHPSISACGGKVRMTQEDGRKSYEGALNRSEAIEDVLGNKDGDPVAVAG